ncbi:MAG: sulfotransferase [Dokdonella sp.]|uniref:sulfotransferase family protein n=1 Tax=Dokdonella sp. TaxID=2291710 RepID=UPI0025BCF14F|nr:sulfotransferase [Dokdonella sp.]MBZ0222845.1 sulfotransferase [Dokdonella sp.]
MDSPRPHQSDRLDGLAPAEITCARMAIAALERGDSGAALAALARAADAAGAHPELLRLQGLALLQQGQVAQALASLRGAALRWPEDALVTCQLGAALAQGGDMVAAHAAFARSVLLDPALVDGWYNLGHASDVLDDTAGACAAFARVLALQPEHLPARVQHAEMLKMLGDLAEAERELRRVLERDRESVSAWVALSNLKTFHPSADELSALLALQASGRVPEMRRIDFEFALASFLENAGRYAQAYELFVAANAAKRRGLRWDAAAVSALVDRIIDAFANLPAVDESSTRGRGVIFFVGMPRSGSTLAEQIVSSHPQVQGGGERNEVVQVLHAESQRRRQPFPDWVGDAEDADWARLGEDFLARCAGWRDQRPGFSNKTLTNWQSVGAIRRMLPAATIVHCRREPLEMLWSCYKHNFGQAQVFTFDLDELVAFWRDCERAMSAWTQQWPRAIQQLDHEALLADPEPRIRELLAACGLDFDPACLAFHANTRDVRTSSASQVRQPLRRDLAVAQRYGDLLDPLRRRIQSRANVQGIAAAPVSSVRPRMD